jgi:general secretion pathway protein I
MKPVFRRSPSAPRAAKQRAPHPCAGARRRQARQRGFTLIEVLVALAIVAVALAAALRATSMLAQNNRALRDKTLALMAAENHMAELRLARAVPPPGKDTVDCPQGPLTLTCETEYTTSQNRGFREVTIRVHSKDTPAITLAELSGLLSNVR